MMSFQILRQRLKETLGPVQIEPREYVKRKQVTFLCQQEKKRKAFFYRVEFLHRFVLMKAFICMLSLHRGEKE